MRKCCTHFALSLVVLQHLLIDLKPFPVASGFAIGCDNNASLRFLPVLWQGGLNRGRQSILVQGNGELTACSPRATKAVK